jgi:hypothetical protein
MDFSNKQTHHIFLDFPLFRHYCGCRRKQRPETDARIHQSDLPAVELRPHREGQGQVPVFGEDIEERVQCVPDLPDSDDAGEDSD